MRRFLIDTNILVRLIVADSEDLVAFSLDVFHRMKQGEFVGMILTDVIAEVLHVATSKRLYNLTRKHVVNKLVYLLKRPGVLIDEEKSIFEALQLYTNHKNINRIDSFLIVKSKHSYDGVITNDKRLKKLLENYTQ